MAPRTFATLATLVVALAGGVALVALDSAPPPARPASTIPEEKTMTQRSLIGALLADLGRWLAARQHAGHEPAFAELDEHALADIGIGAGELTSIAAEARGDAPLTRLRIVLGAQRG